MYIYLNKPYEKIKKMNKDKRSILVANEGILVTEKNKPGTYLDDDYNLQSFKKKMKKNYRRKINNRKNIELLLKHIKELSK